MERLMNKKFVRKIVLVILIILSLNFIAYPVNQAATGRSEDESDDAGGVLAFPIAFLANALGDAANNLLETFLIGDDATAAVINGDKAVDYMDGDPSKVEYSKKAPDSSPEDSNLPEIKITRDAIKPVVGNYDVGIVKLTPAEIFAGNVAALDANFFDTSNTNPDTDGKLGGKSIVSQIRGTIAGWYVSIRNIAIVGLLSVLVYLGIRMIISTSVGDKAKYKQLIVDWVIALCLIFFLHYIMSFAMTLSEAITDLISGHSCEDGTINQVIVQLTDNNNNPIDDRRFYSNFVNVARIKSQLPNAASKLGYAFMYVFLTGLTAYYAFIYMKRLVMLAFLTMIAPFVALTYPLDKLKDGHAQAFNFWLKEYIFYAMLQPLHMLLYTIFITSAIDIAANNMIYAIAALLFMVPAEKVVKQMFGIKGSTEGNIGGFAGGAVAGSLMSKLNKPPKPQKDGGGGGSGGGNSKPRIARNPNGTSFNSILNAGAPGSGNAGGGSLPASFGGASGLGSGASAAPTTAASTTINGRRVYTSPPPGRGSGSGTASRAGTSYGTGTRTGTRTGASFGTGASNARRTIGLPHGSNPKPGFKQRIANGVKNSAPVRYTGKKLDQLKNTRAGKAAGYYSRKIKNSNFGRAVGRRYKLAGGAGGIAKKVLGTAAKTYLRGAGMAAGLLVGGAIGAIGDGPEGALKGATAGIVGGGALGNRVAVGGGNLVHNTLTGRNALGSFASEVMTGDPDASDRKKWEDRYAENPDVLNRILQDHPDFSAKQIRDYARQEYNMMYDSKTDDADNADKAIELEQSFIDDGMDADEAHTRAAGILNATKSFDKSIFNNDKKLWEAEDALTSNLMTQGFTQQEAIARTDSAFQDLAKLYGAKVDIGEKRAQRTQRTNQQQNNNSQSNRGRNRIPRSQLPPNLASRLNSARSRSSSNTTTNQNVSGTTRTTRQTSNTSGTTRTINTSNARTRTTSQNQTRTTTRTNQTSRTTTTSTQSPGTTTQNPTTQTQTSSSTTRPTATARRVNSSSTQRGTSATTRTGRTTRTSRSSSSRNSRNSGGTGGTTKR